MINSDSAAPPGPGHAQTAEPSFHLHSKSDQELAEAGALAAAAEEKEPEVVSPPKAEVRATSAGPESAKPSPGAAPSSAAPSYPAAASYPSPVSTAASSSSAAPSLAMHAPPAPSSLQTRAVGGRVTLEPRSVMHICILPTTVQCAAGVGDGWKSLIDI